MTPLPSVSLPSAGFALAAAAGGFLGHLLARWARRLVRDADGVDAPMTTADPGTVNARAFEWLVASLCTLAWWQYGMGPLFVSRVVFGCALILLFTIDIHRHQLPNEVTMPGIALGIAFSLVTEPGWASSLIGTALGAAILWTMAELSRQRRGESGVGMGDVKMLAMIGAFAGWKLTLVALMVALVSASTTSLVLTATRRAAAPRVLPFGSFLSVGAVVAIAGGPMLIDWYWRLIPALVR